MAAVKKPTLAKLAQTSVGGEWSYSEELIQSKHRADTTGLPLIVLTIDKIRENT